MGELHTFPVHNTLLVAYKRLNGGSFQVPSPNNANPSCPANGFGTPPALPFAELVAPVKSSVKIASQLDLSELNVVLVCAVLQT